jgi:hypothetical protein
MENKKIMKTTQFHNMLKQKAGLFAGVAITLLTLSTCADTPVSPDPDAKPDPTGTVSFFPNSRDVVWTYELYDSLVSAPLDTITITIKGTRVLQQTGNVVRVWETFHRSTNLTDSTYVRVVGDSVQFYGSDLASTNHALALLPLFFEQRWENPGRFLRDSGGVFSIDSISVPAGDFPVAAQVINGWNTNFISDGNLTTIWVVDSIGIVQRQDFSKVVIGSFTQITENVGWKLLSSSQIVSP